MPIRTAFGPPDGGMSYVFIGRGGYSHQVRGIVFPTPVGNYYFYPKHGRNQKQHKDVLRDRYDESATPLGSRVQRPGT